MNARQRIFDLKSQFFPLETLFTLLTGGTNVRPPRTHVLAVVAKVEAGQDEGRVCAADRPRLRDGLSH